MSTITDSRYRPIADIAREIPPTRKGRPVHPQTVVKWITHGIPLNDGSILKLVARRFPSCWMTTDEAVIDFIDRLTQDKSGESVPMPTAVKAPRLSHERAERELAAAGL